MDCSGRYKFAVLAHEEEENKIVTILLNGVKIEINPALSKAKINGVDYAVTEGPYALKNAENETYGVIKRTTDNFIELNSPYSHMVRVLSNREEVVIMSSPLHRGRMCGLCGSLTGDKLTDLTGPRQCSIPRDFMDVAYELKTPTGCKSGISSDQFFELHHMQKECLNKKLDHILGISGTSPVLSHFQERILADQLAVQPNQLIKYRNEMVTVGNKRCFSTEPVAKCVEGSRAENHVEKKVALSIYFVDVITICKLTFSQ